MKKFFFLSLSLSLLLVSSLSASPVEEARLLYKEGKLDQAIQLLQEKNNNQTVALAYLGTLFSLKGDGEAALKAYKQAVALEPQSTRYLNNVAVTYFDLDNEEEAKKWFLKVLEVDPKNKRALEYMELFAVDQEEHDGMMEELEENLRPEKGDFEGNLKSASVFYRIRKWDLARKYFERANELNGNHYGVKQKLARLAYRRFEPAVSVQYWEEAQRLEPDKIEPFQEAARLYSAMGLYRKSMFCWNRVSQLASEGSETNKEAQYYMLMLAPYLSQKISAP